MGRRIRATLGAVARREAHRDRRGLKKRRTRLPNQRAGNRVHFPGCLPEAQISVRRVEQNRKPFPRARRRSAPRLPTCELHLMLPSGNVCRVLERHDVRAVPVHRRKAHAAISGNSSRQHASTCEPIRSVIMTSAPASLNATALRSRGRTAPAFQRPGTCAASSSASPRAADTQRPAKRGRLHVRRLHGKARWLARALRSPRHRTPQCVRRACRARTSSRRPNASAGRRTASTPRRFARRSARAHPESASALLRRRPHVAAAVHALQSLICLSAGAIADQATSSP